MTEYLTLEDVCTKGSSNIAQKELDGNEGEYEIYGASGLIKKVDFFHQDKPYIAVVKDGAGVGRTMLLPAKSSVIGTMQYIIPCDNVDIEYLYYAITYMDLSRYYMGAAIPHIYFKDYKKEKLPVPDIDTQKRIAAKFRLVDKLITFRQSQLSKFSELTASRFLELFGDVITNPKGYDICKLYSLANKISDGVHAKPVYTETGKPFISVVNINKGVLNFDGCKYVSEEAYQKMVKSTHPEQGDILYTKVGATYGIPAFVDTDTEFCLYVSVCLIKPKHDIVNARFLALSMGMPYVKHQADQRIKGIGVPDLHLNQISEFEIVCPPRNEQDDFVSFVTEVDKSKLAVQKSLEQLETLKKSLMQKYFG